MGRSFNGIMNKYALLFPGQGSQSIGMLNSIIDLHITKEIFQITSDKLGVDLIDLTINGDEKLLSDTKITQPLILATNHVFLKIFQENFNIDSSLIKPQDLLSFELSLLSPTTK